MARLVQEGKDLRLGLSEVSPGTLERAYRVHPIAAVQSEHSLWTRDPEDGVLEACRRLGIGLVAFSPLGRGFLSGQVKNTEELEPEDRRPDYPRFQGAAFGANLRLVDKLKAIATAKGVAAAQLALAWVMAQRPDAVPKLARWRATSRPEAVAAYTPMWAKEGLPDMNTRISAPLLAITGEDDREDMRSVPMLAALKRLSDAAQTAPLVHCGHCPMQEMPPLFATIVERFLAKPAETSQ